MSLCSTKRTYYSCSMYLISHSYVLELPIREQVIRCNEVFRTFCDRAENQAQSTKVWKSPVTWLSDIAENSMSNKYILAWTLGVTFCITKTRAKPRVIKSCFCISPEKYVQKYSLFYVRIIIRIWAPTYGSQPISATHFVRASEQKYFPSVKQAVVLARYLDLHENLRVSENH